MTGAEVVSDDRPRRRPMRACTARTPARLAPAAPLPPNPKRGTPVKKPAAENSSPSQPFTPIALTSSPLPAQEERWQLRNMWELAAVLNFLHVFRPVLGIGDEFSAEDLESALLVPNNRLGNIHILLLKAVPPVHRSPLNLDTWVTILSKKIQTWWPWIVEGPCPLVPAHGQELEVYKDFGPGTRLNILKALCEIRLDQEDVRLYIEQSIKQGHSVSNFRKERLGADMFGTTYWYFDDPMLGHRLCRDTRVEPKLKYRVKARDYPAPSESNHHWETLATNYEEFHFVAEQLTLSTQKLEAALGKKITSDILPELEEMQKKKERVLKKQQRQAVLLDNLIHGNGLAAGRSRRDRKPVSYTFDDYDRSINEAIKFTKKRQSSPEESNQQDMKGIYDRSNGVNGHSATYSGHASGINGNHGDHGADAEDLPNVSSGRRQSRRSQRYSESEYVGTIYDDGETSSDDEIEGEAIYDENYLREKKRRKKLISSSDDEDYRGDEVEEASLEDDDIEDIDDDDDDGHYHRSRSQQERNTGKRKRKEHKLKSVDELQGGLSWGLRRSKRATKSEIDYSKFGGDSESEDEENAVGYRGTQGRDRATTSLGGDSDASFGPSDDSQGGRESDADSEGFQDLKKNKQKLKDLHDRKDVTMAHLHVDDKPAMRSSAVGTGQQQHGASFLRSEHSNGRNQSTKYASHSDIKPRRFLDLNVAAPAGGGFEEAAGTSNHVNADAHGDDDRSFQVQSDDEDDDYFGDGGRVDVSSSYTNNGFTPSSSVGAKAEG
ncbi:unnamed protein product [Calypogeia fissa]